MKRSLLVLIVLISSQAFVGIQADSVPCYVSSTQCYVSTTGNDAHRGTIDMPWGHIRRAMESDIPPGTTVNIKGGTCHGLTVAQNEVRNVGTGIAVTPETHGGRTSVSSDNLIADNLIYGCDAGIHVGNYYCGAVCDRSRVQNITVQNNTVCDSSSGVDLYPELKPGRLAESTPPTVSVVVQ